jgi:DNA polymerase-1
MLSFHTDFDIPTAITFARMRRRGLTIDVREMLDQQEESKKREATYLKRLRRYGITCKNPNSDKQLSEELFQQHEIDTGAWGKATNSRPKQMAVNKDALLDVKEHFPHWGELMDTILAYRAEKHFRSTFITGVACSTYSIRDGIGKTHGGLRWPGTVTWRPRASKGATEVNCLNFPKGNYRKIVISRYEGGSIVAADYSQAELVTLAALSQDRRMKRIYLTGGDIHQETQDALGLDDRRVAKNINFGVVFGIEKATFKKTLRKGGIIVTEEQAGEWIADWKKAYPLAALYMTELQKRAVRFRKVEAPNYGVVRTFHFVGGKSDSKLAREGANMPIQAGAACTTDRAANIFDNSLDLEQGLLVNCQYDELIAEAAAGREQEVAVLMKDSMIQAAKEQPWLDLPLGVDVAIGKSWGELEAVE